MLITLNHHSAYCYTGGKTFQADLPTVLFIHGAQNDHSVWALQSRYFAHHGFNVLAVDLPGHGRSTGAAMKSIEEMADWLIALMDAVGVTNATLIGHSMGSLIALETSAKAGTRIDKLVLVGTAYPMKVSDTLLNAAKNEEQKAIDMVNIWSHTTVLKPSYSGPGNYASGMSQRLMQRISAINSDKVFYTDFAACNAYRNGEIAAQKRHFPTMLLLGKKDMMTPPKATQVLRESLHDCKIVLIENCGHSLMSEQPGAVLNALYAFVKT